VLVVEVLVLLVVGGELLVVVVARTATVLLVLDDVVVTVVLLLVLVVGGRVVLVVAGGGVVVVGTPVGIWSAPMSYSPVRTCPSMSVVTVGPVFTPASTIGLVGWMWRSPSPKDAADVPSLTNCGFTLRLVDASGKQDVVCALPLQKY
jgi:hypothetical protein